MSATTAKAQTFRIQDPATKLFLDGLDVDGTYEWTANRLMSIAFRSRQLAEYRLRLVRNQHPHAIIVPITEDDSL